MHEAQNKPFERYPGYNVMQKRCSPSWNIQTRRVIERRLATSDAPLFFTPDQFETVRALAARIVPQPCDGALIPVAALVDRKLHEGVSDGYRVAAMPREREAWRLGLRALEAEAKAAHAGRFHELSEVLQDSLLQRMESGQLSCPEWGSVRPEDFF